MKTKPVTNEVPPVQAVDPATPLFGPEMAVIQGIIETDCEVYALPEVGSGQRRMVISARDGRGHWMKAKISTINIVVEFEDGTWGLIHPSKLSTHGARHEPTSGFVPARPNAKAEALSLSEVDPPAAGSHSVA